jgi:hypothetical protein
MSEEAHCSARKKSHLAVALFSLDTMKSRMKVACARRSEAVERMALKVTPPCLRSPINALAMGTAARMKECHSITGGIFSIRNPEKPSLEPHMVVCCNEAE